MLSFDKLVLMSASFARMVALKALMGVLMLIGLLLPARAETSAQAPTQLAQANAARGPAAKSATEAKGEDRSGSPASSTEVAESS